MTGEAIRARVEHLVSDRFPLEGEGHCGRRAGRGGLEEPRQANVAVARVHLVAAEEEVLALRRREPRDARDPKRVVSRHRFQHPQEAVDEALDRGAIEQRRRIVQRAAHLPPGLLQLKGRVELRRSLSGAEQGDGQPRDFRPCTGLLLPGKQHLEHRRVSQASRRLERLHDLLEGEILVRVRRKYLPARAVKEFADGRIAGQVDADRERIHEEPDERLDLLSATPHNRSSDDDVILLGQATEHRAPGSEQRHVESAPVISCEPTDPVRQGHVERHRDARPLVALLLRARAIGRKLEAYRRTGEGLLPVRDMAGKRLPRQPTALPYRIVRILNRKRREWVRVASTECRVERSEFGEEDPYRPPVRDDVMHRDAEQVLACAETSQTEAHEWVALQIEAGAGVRLQARHHAALVVRAAYRVESDRQAGRRLDDLKRFTVDLHEARAEHLVPLDDSIERRLERRDIEIAAQLPAAGHMIGSTGAFKLRQEPHSALRKRHRDR